MSRSKELYQFWSTDPFFDEKTRAELLAIADNEEEIEERFYTNLSFGTAGLRGILGAGTNRMNIYTVAMATEGFARYIDTLGDEAKERGIVISYDCRNFSPDFALIAALIFATHGTHVRLVDELRPTPMLSFAVRHYNCAGGVMVTASHNPAKYNGYKAYGEDGGQMPPEAADVVLREMDSITDPRTLSWITEEEALNRGLLEYIGPELDDAYMAMLRKLTINEDKVREQADMKIVFTPLHGTGNKPVRRILKEIGFENVIVVPEQELPDGNFSTVKSPNPEERSALAMAIALAEKEEADLVIATDPDGDRTGLCIRKEDGSYQVMSGNEIGILLMNYILSAKQARGTLPENSFVITTIVSTKLPRKIAAHYGVELMECLTGFKWIAELIKLHDEQGDKHFQFGFEESFGYLAGTAVRDKDAVVASMLLAEMAATAKSEGKTLNDYLKQLNALFGFGEEKTYSLVREGKAGLEAITKTMVKLRADKMRGFPNVDILRVLDVQESTVTDMKTGEVSPLDLPESDVLLYQLDGLDFFCVRPSGTEPKIKVYFGAYDQDAQVAKDKLASFSKAIVDEVESLLDNA